MDTIKTIRAHGLVLIACSLAGFFGYYLQTHYFQATAFIPATVGLILWLLSAVRFKNSIVKYGLLFLIVLVFGIILTRMSIKFVPQQFQPLRKRIYFPVMALSSIFTIGVMLENYLARKRTNAK